MAGYETQKIFAGMSSCIIVCRDLAKQLRFIVTLFTFYHLLAFHVSIQFVVYLNMSKFNLFFNACLP